MKIFPLHNLFKNSDSNIHKPDNRQEMSNDYFIEAFGRNLDGEEKKIALKMRYIISEVSENKAELIYPSDNLLKLFTQWWAVISESCSYEILEAMTKNGFFKIYKIDLKKVRNPDIDDDITVSEFINDIIHAIEAA